METGTLIIIIFIIAIIVFLVQAVPTYFRNRKEIEASIQSSLSSDEQIIHKQTLGVHYLGEHPPFGPPSSNGDMVITDKGIIFSNAGEKRIFKIPYEDMVDISTETKESLTATRIVLTGLLAPLWKKKKPFILIGMKNDIGEISKVGFGFSEPGLGSSFWPTSRWFQVISEQRYNWFKNKKTSS
jgi:hypothetical protein